MKLQPIAASLFSPLPVDVRANAPARYLAYLKGRDGRLDLSTRTLSGREPFFERLATDPVRAEVAIDLPRFHRNHEAREPDLDLPRELLWLLAIAKANRTEYYGMEEHIAVNGILDGDLADTQAYVDMQEVYHTRILLDVLRCFGLDVTLGKPELASRIAVQAMVRLPQKMAMPLILCAELTASVAFRLLLDEGRVLFGGQPALWQRASTLLEQIMVDEVGHVSYCRVRLGRMGLAIARALLPSVARSLLSDQRELAMLIGNERFTAALAAFDPLMIAEGCHVAPFWIEGQLEGALADA